MKTKTYKFFCAFYSLSFYAAICVLCVMLSLASCGGNPSVDALHRTADSLITAGRPDSALLLLNMPSGAGAENYSTCAGETGLNSSQIRSAMLNNSKSKDFEDLKDGCA